MPKSKWNLNTIYISERLQESLRPISRCAMTTVVAPMGYGKTTAVEWYLAERARAEAPYIVRISVYSSNLAIFWKSVQDAFARAGFAFLREYDCPTDGASGGLLIDDLCHALTGEKSCYIFIDDFHLLTDKRAPGFLCALAGRLPPNVHLILASRDLFLPAAELVRLGGKVYQIGTAQLRLNHTELAVYTKRCGTALSDEQIDTLLYYSEGWFSAVYLNLRMFSEHGVLPDPNSDISSKERQTVYRGRLGIWYEDHRLYLHAMIEYRQNGDYDAMLRTLQKDAGILLSSLHPKAVLAALDECPAAVLASHPLAILVLMRSMFNWRNIPKMLELKELLLTAISENTALSAQEKGDLRGECDLIMSFLCYNDISAMSRLHRSASAQMSRKAISIQSGGGWTFGSPSVLMMFYRAPGELQSELAEMDECMPHYYKITGNHGQGAETIMRAEAAFLQGRLTDAHIELESACARIQDNGQANMALCCDFLAWRLSLFAEMKYHCTLAERHAELLRQHNASWLNLWNAIAAYYYALLGKTDKIPEVFRAHRLSTVHTLAPGKPMIEMIENQVGLAQGDYARVVGRSERLLAVCEGMHYALVAMHIRIQTAAAYEMLGKHAEAQAQLDQALTDAEPDGFVIPFAENYRYLKPLLTERLQTGTVAQIIELGEAAERRKAGFDRPEALSALTEREYEIVRLMAQRLNNREIAEKLYLSEGSIRQYVNQIYTKLQIAGEPRAKRKLLLDLLADKN